MSDIKDKKLNDSDVEKVTGGIAATDYNIEPGKPSSDNACEHDAGEDKKRIKEYGGDGVVDITIPGVSSKN